MAKDYESKRSKNRRLEREAKEKQAQLIAERTAARSQFDIDLRNYEAKNNPLFQEIYDLIGDDPTKVQSTFNKARRTKVFDSNEKLHAVENFYNENKHLFFDTDGNKLAFNGAGNIPEWIEKPEWSSINGSTTTNATNTKAKVIDVENPKFIGPPTEEIAAKQMAKETANEGVDALTNSNMKSIFNKRSFNVVLNAGFAIADYKNAREEGKGVLPAAAKAGALFAAGEILQGAMLPVMLAGSLPKMAVGAVEGLQSMTRQMNSTTRLQTFGNAQFQDTQQLATMRQAGMEMARMSQYNLQQSIMGNEAQHMHRL